ncbi:MAG: DUF1934 domain-containing protein [Firmicutes bacterium]|nr:DUF1934 domain-containing protein [Candidatus Colimorpha enterica]
MSGTAVKVKIKSTMLNVAAEEQEIAELTPLLKDGESIDDRMAEIEKEATEVIEYTASGVMTTEDGLTVITYAEPEEIGLGASTAVITFNAEHRDTVTFARNGMLSFTIVLDKKSPDSISPIYLPEGRLDLTVRTNKVYNNVKGTRGSILLDYSLLQFGTVIQRNRFFIEVRNG